MVASRPVGRSNSSRLIHPAQIATELKEVSAALQLAGSGVLDLLALRFPKFGGGGVPRPQPFQQQHADPTRLRERLSLGRVAAPRFRSHPNSSTLTPSGAGQAQPGVLEVAAGETSSVIFAIAPSASLLKIRLKGEGGAAE